LRYLAELAARKQRRSLSGYSEWAVAQSLKAVPLYVGQGYGGAEEAMLTPEINKRWYVGESERIITIATTYPEPMNHEEQEQWKMLMDSRLLEPAMHRLNNQLMLDPEIMVDNVYPMVRAHWDSLKLAHAGGSVRVREWVNQIRDEMIA